MKNYSNSNLFATLVMCILLVIFGVFGNAFIYWLLWDHAVLPVCVSLGYTLPAIKFAHFAIISAVIACLGATNKDNKSMEVAIAWAKYISIFCSKIIMVLIAMLLVKMLL